MTKKISSILGVFMIFQHCFGASNLDPLTLLMEEIKEQNIHQKEINDENEIAYKVSLGVGSIGIIYLVGSLLAHNKGDIEMATVCGVSSSLILATLASAAYIYSTKDIDYNTKRMNRLFEKSKKVEEFIALTKMDSQAKPNPQIIKKNIPDENGLKKPENI